MQDLGPRSFPGGDERDYITKDGFRKATDPIVADISFIFNTNIMWW
jgi:hypothetical protein